MFDTLEKRALLASIASGVLNVPGTGGADVIDIFLRNGAVVARIGAAEQTFTGVKSIVVDAQGGNDRITVSSAIKVPTTLSGGSGNDTITGGTGSDLINGGTGNDRANGNGGFDSFTYAGRTTPVQATLFSVPPAVGSTRIRFSGSGGSTGETDTYTAIQRLIGGSGNDKFETHVGSDTATGNMYPLQPDGSHTIVATHLEGGDGNDDLRLNGPFDTDINSQFVIFAPILLGGNGNDTLHFGGLSDGKIYGQSGNDTLDVDQFDDVGLSLADGGSGTDTQVVNYVGNHLHAYADQLAPNFENAVLIDAPSFFRGNELSNRITGNGGESVYGGGGNDFIQINGVGPLSLFGESGNDTVTGGAGADLIRGGTGLDNLSGGLGGDKVYGDDDNDIVDGGDGNDAVFGGNGNDLVIGYSGNDYLEGSAGSDTLNGGSGRDTLNGGTGIDLLDGGGDNDLFQSRDGALDSLYGNAGFDTAQRDNSEAILNSIEARAS